MISLDGLSQANIFSAGFKRTNISFDELIYFRLLATAGSLATPPVPSASVVSILVVLSSIDIQVHNVGLLMALEWYK